MNLRFGLDLVPVPSVAQRLADEGLAYLERIYTRAEIESSEGSRGADTGRLAERLAVKAATLKLLPVAGEAIDYREIELVAQDDGRLGIALHGRAAEFAAAAGIGHIAVSVTCDERLAAAVVAAEIDEERATVTDPAVAIPTIR